MDVRYRTTGSGSSSEQGDNNNKNITIIDSNTMVMQQRKSSALLRSSKQSSTMPKQLIFIVTVIVVGVVVLVSLPNGSFLDHLHSNGNKGGNFNTLKNMESMMETLRNENDQLKKQINEINDHRDTQEQQLPKGGDNNDVVKLHSFVEKLREYKQKMHQTIQSTSKRLVLEKYGEGPHVVDIHVEFDPDSNIYEKTTKEGGIITIELASVQDMPATIYLFLEQVSHKLMNGCSFHRNAGHVVQGGPASNFIQSTAKHHEFKKALLESVPFQEYSPNFPHKKYTLGYAGRPGGPDFYISTLDNTRNHGPGGQSSYDDPSEADPCFAKVIAGFDIVDLMHKSAVKPGGYNAMQHNIAIREMILQQQPTTQQ